MHPNQSTTRAIPAKGKGTKEAITIKEYEETVEGRSTFLTTIKKIPGWERDLPRRSAVAAIKTNPILLAANSPRDVAGHTDGDRHTTLSIPWRRNWQGLPRRRDLRDCEPTPL